METRKLQQVGGGTFTVSIPKAWATEHGLEAGAEVHLYTHSDGSVVVRSAERDGGQLESVRIEVPSDATECAPATRPLRAAQEAGFETATLVHPDSFTDEQRRAVRALASDFVGTELVVERADELTVRNLLDAGDVSIRQSLVQLEYVALAIHREATAALVDADEGVAERLADRRREPERLFAMVGHHCRRSLTSFEAVDRLGVTRPELFDCYEIARHLRAVADSGVRIARVADRLSSPLPAEVGDAVAEAGQSARAVVEEATSAAVDEPDLGAAHDALDDRDALRAEVQAMEAALGGAASDGDDASGSAPFETVSRTGSVALGQALDSLVRTADRGGRIARVALSSGIRADGDATGIRAEGDTP